MNKTVLYLRTDICDDELTAGGSVAHTIGVIQGLTELGYEVMCASSCMHQVLKKQKLKKLIKLVNPPQLRFLRWKLNCLLSSFIFFLQTRTILQNQDVLFIYQRYSLLNMTGVLLKWWYKKKLILEYNGSEAWIATHWVTKKRLITFEWLMQKTEKITLKNADLIVVVSQVLQDELVSREVEPRRIVVNPNGVDAQAYTSIKHGRVYEAH